MRRVSWLLACMVAALPASAQGLDGIDLNALKQQMAQQAAQGVTGTQPSAPNRAPVPQAASAPAGNPQVLSADSSREARIRDLKAGEGGLARFGADLFEERQPSAFATDGGVSEDYVIGPGDQLYLNATGSANFDFTTAVDGSGGVAIPKVGSARIAGLTLGKARTAIQRQVDAKFSRTQVDIQVVHLREIRVSILGEVYAPGSYLVPSLASLVNVLGLSGGPTAAGSYRDIRVMRGGRAAYHLDLYPLRAEGLGNPDFALQSGDVVFVPLAGPQALLEGAFRRVGRGGSVASAQTGLPAEDASALEREALTRRIQAVQAQLAAPPPAAPGKGFGTQASGMDERTRGSLEAQLVSLNAQLAALSSRALGDHRVRVDPATGAPEVPEDPGVPAWIRRWEETGQAPRMSFELKPGETLAETCAFAGGLMPEVASRTLTVRRKDASGAISAFTVDSDSPAMAVTALAQGDLVSAMPQRETLARVVRVEGWARVPGEFSRTEGLRVGDLLRRNDQVLPDTYLARGEVIHLALDGTTRYEAFDVKKALSGDPAADLLLQDRDRILLYRIGDRRLPKLLTVNGPVAYPGTFAFYEGMRASDLVFRAGVLQKNADQYEAQLSRVKDGQSSVGIPLDLGKLASSDTASPVGLLDDAANPILLPGDQISFFKRPGYLPHHLVTLDGQVARPGVYALEDAHETLSHLLARAGGLTPEAMPAAGIFLRRVGERNLRDALDAQDPLSVDINAILARLNETKRSPFTGTLLESPLLHALFEGDMGRLVVDFQKALKGDSKADVEMLDGDRIIIPRHTEEAYVVGETASPFAVYKVGKGLTVRDLLKLAGGPTRNADTWNIRLLKADGRIMDSWVMRKQVEPGDAVLVPQRIRRDTTWQENLQALTPIAILLNTLK